MDRTNINPRFFNNQSIGLITSLELYELVNTVSGVDYNKRWWIDRTKERGTKKEEKGREPHCERTGPDFLCSFIFKKSLVQGRIIWGSPFASILPMFCLPAYNFYGHIALHASCILNDACLSNFCLNISYNGLSCLNICSVVFPSRICLQSSLLVMDLASTSTFQTFSWHFHHPSVALHLKCFQSHVGSPFQY